MRLISTDCIWDASASARANHCAFGDLILHQDMLLAVFREADVHVSNEAQIRLLGQKQCGGWVNLGTIRVSERDLRDPHFWLQSDGTLCITAAMVDRGQTPARSATYAWPISRRRLSNLVDGGSASTETDGSLFALPEILTDQNLWLWRVLGDSSGNFGFGYDGGELRFCRSTSSAPFEMGGWVLDEFDKAKVNEAALCFSTSERLVSLLRCDPHRWRSDTAEVSGIEACNEEDVESALAYFGTSYPPYSDWTWKQFPKRLGGPVMIPASAGGYWAAFRTYENPVCWEPQWVEVVKLAEDGQVDRELRLPSGGPDCGYPGLVEWRDSLYCLYYSSHEPERHTSIYLAKISF